MIFNPRCTCCCQSPVIFQAHYKLVKRSLINVSHYRAILFMIMHICARHCLRLGTIYENRRTAVTFLFRPFFSNPKKTNDRIPCLWIFHRTIILKQHKSCRGKKKAGEKRTRFLADEKRSLYYSSSLLCRHKYSHGQFCICKKSVTVFTGVCARNVQLMRGLRNNGAIWNRKFETKKGHLNILILTFPAKLIKPSDKNA